MYVYSICMYVGTVCMYVCMYVCVPIFNLKVGRCTYMCVCMYVSMKSEQFIVVVVVVLVTRTPLIESTIAAAMRLYDSSAAEVRDTYPISNLHNIESMTMLSLEVWHCTVGTCMQYIHTVYTVHTYCLYSTYILFIQYIHTVYTVHTYCLYSTYKLFIQYIHTVYTVHTYCLYSTYISF